MPWVRLHALRDYYAMPALLLKYPDVHVTINVTPVLLDPILDYAEGRARDEALALTRVPAGRLSPRQREARLKPTGTARSFPQAVHRAVPLRLQGGTSVPPTCATFRSGSAWPGSTRRSGTVA
jgi:alpha-amylase/alpha-mannosidase (GH57 family)